VHSPWDEGRDCNPLRSQCAEPGTLARTPGRKPSRPPIPVGGETPGLAQAADNVYDLQRFLNLSVGMIGYWG